MKRQFIHIFITIALITFTLIGRAADLNALLQGFTSLSADFTQTMVDVNGNKQSSNGKIMIQKPNRFRFEILTPEPELFVSDGSKLWNEEPDLQQVTVSQLADNLSNTPLLLLSGEAKQITALFQVHAINDTTFKLIPKKQDSLIKSVTLVFDNNIPTTLIIHNTLDSITTLHFTHIKLNPDLSPSPFHFVPKKGESVLQ